jgi:hypothetical protein
LKEGEASSHLEPLQIESEISAINETPDKNAQLKFSFDDWGLFKKYERLIRD